MDKYTYEDIIMDPDDPRLDGAIGKECYFGDYPDWVLDYANNLHDNLFRLKEINKNDAQHFVGEKYNNSWTLIIIKKEEKPEYIPFEDGDEFLECYLSKANNPSKHKLESVGGIWLKDKETDAYCMVTEIWDMGIVIGDKNMTIGATTAFNDITDWDDILENYTFLDGSPCGKEVK